MKKQINTFPKMYVLDFGEPRLQTATKYVECFLNLGEIPEVGFLNPDYTGEFSDIYVLPSGMVGNHYYETPDSDVLTSELEHSDMMFIATVATDVSDQHRIQLIGLPEELRQEMNGFMLISYFDAEGELFVENYLSLIGSKEEK